ncbi:MAG: hypothetical protein ACI4HI_15090 [Lachnospiraceae bacterium]
MRRRFERAQKCVIGIMGATNGVGTTHLAIALTNFFSDIKRKKTALLEINEHGQLATMLPDEGAFTIKNAIYYPQVDPRDVPGLCNGAQEITILDLGSEYQKNRLEFLRCDKKIVIGSMCPWKQESYLHFLDMLQQEENYRQWLHCLILFGDKKDKRKISSEYHISAFSVPFIADPFHLNKKEMTFIKKLVQ